MKQLCLIGWLILLTLLIGVSLFIYFEYFRGKVPESKKQYGYSGETIIIQDANQSRPPLTGTVVYHYTKNNKSIFHCRFINDNGNIRYFDLIPSEFKFKNQ